MAEALAGSFESKEDYELYTRLMSERQRIQQQTEERRRKRQAVRKVKPAQPVNLEERERGFQVHFSGANAERIEDARRRQGAAKASPEVQVSRKEWQVETVELKGKDGEVYRCSPSGRSDSVGRKSVDSTAKAVSEDEIGEELDGSGWEDSRPGSGVCTPVGGVDRETRGVLHIMQTANRDQLTYLRESLESQIRGSPKPSPDVRASRSSGGSRPSSSSRSGMRRPSPPPRRGFDAMGSGGYTGGASAGVIGSGVVASGRRSERVLSDSQRIASSRPSSANAQQEQRPSSASSAIASAIAAENARVRRLAESGGTNDATGNHGFGDPAWAAAAAGRPVVSTSSRPPSGSSSRGGARLPLNPEDAAAFAPPSALGSGGYGASSATPPQRRQPSEGGCGGYTGASPPLPPSGYGGQMQQPTPSSSSNAPVATSPHPANLPRPTAAQTKGGSDKDIIVERVSRLDTRKQKALLRVLESLETDASGTSAASSAPAPSATTGPSAQPSAPSEHDTAALCLRVLSNWGDSRQCGLSQIEAFDMQGNVLRLPPAALSLHGTQSGSTSLGRLVDGRSKSTSEKEMWVATTSLRQHGEGFEPFTIMLHLPPSSVVPGALRVWNFNSPGGLSKGVRSAEVLRGSGKVWEGEIPQGRGVESGDFMTIPLDPGFQVLGNSQVSNAESSVSESCELWLDGVPIRADLESDESVSPKPKKRDIAKHEKELADSLQALESFRASQSRRLFGSSLCSSSQGFYELHGNGKEQLETDVKAHTAGDWRPVVASDSVAQRTAVFGGGVTDSPKDTIDKVPFGDQLAGNDLSFKELFDGGAIPVRSFDENDQFDGPEPPRPDSVFGTSLVATNFNPGMSVVIPVLPTGKEVIFNCVSTWGDECFVGLSGIEIFDGCGLPVAIQDPKRQVIGNPESINVLPEYENDPRTADKLFDGVNLTRDDLHTWLAPFFQDKSHTVTVDLERKTSISMIRVWNYNKSRQHSSRGVRDLEILLDGVPIFVGEIRQATGAISSPEEVCEHILLTQDENVLHALEANDWLSEHLPAECDEDDDLSGEVNSLGMTAQALVRKPFG